MNKDLEILRKLRTLTTAEQLAVDKVDLEHFFDRIDKFLHGQKAECEKKLIVYTDAAARGNPGPAGIGIVIQNEDDKVVKEHYEFIGEQTNNTAEYMAFIKGLELARDMKADSILVQTDSELLANQINGVHKVKHKALIDLYINAKKLLNNFTKVEINHIDRGKNKDADRLANLAIDSKI